MAVMSRTQSNVIHGLSKQVGLDPVDFSLSAEEQMYRGEVEVFKHRPTGSHLRLSLKDSSVWLTWWPKFRVGETSVFVGSWDEVYAIARAWLMAVKVITTRPTCGRRPARSASYPTPLES